VAMFGLFALACMGAGLYVEIGLHSWWFASLFIPAILIIIASFVFPGPEGY